MLKNISFMLLVVFLGGCAGSPARIGMMSADELHTENSFNLCNAYNSIGSENAKAELIRRKAIPDNEWLIIEQKKIKLGMSELGLICSWGNPSIYGAINRTVTSNGEKTQWVYRTCQSCKGKYAYTRNGKITSWQN